MEKNRLVGRLFPLILLGVSVGISAVEVLPQPSGGEASLPSSPQIAQPSVLSRSKIIASQQLAAPVTTVAFTPADQQKLAENNAAAPVGTPVEVGVVKLIGIDVELIPKKHSERHYHTYGYM